MPQIVQVRYPAVFAQVKYPVIAAVTDYMGRIDARKEADKLAAEHGLIVADMPMAIHAMTNHPEVREAVRSGEMINTSGWICTITGEYHGQRDGDRSYETWHSVGSLATTKGLEKAFSKDGDCDHGFMPIADYEWVAVGRGSYDGQNVARIHLDDVRRGSVPAEGTPYTVFTRLDKDEAKIINGRGQLGYDAFMQDDRVLMATGSPENREALAKMLFGRKEDGGEGWSIIDGYNRINDAGFGAKAKGRLVDLLPFNGGLHGFDYLPSLGIFLGVRAGGAASLKTGPTRKRLEDILNLFKWPNLVKA